jgi:hypothetical protein
MRPTSRLLDGYLPAYATQNELALEAIIPDLYEKMHAPINSMT